MKIRFDAALAILLGTAGSLHAQRATQPPESRGPGQVEEALPGERLDPGTYAPGRIETLERVRERARTTSAEPAVASRRGAWVVPKRSAAGRARSGLRHLTNEWGDPRLGIGFRSVVAVEGAWISGQANAAVWPRALRAVGYLGAERVAATAWFGPLDEAPAWFEIALEGVDRIEFEALPAFEGAAWFALDDLAFRRGGERVLLDFEDLEYGARLSLPGGNYAGLEWELGSGFTRPLALDADAVPAPRAAAIAPESPAAPPAGFLGGGGTAPVAIFDFAGPDRVVANNAYPPDTCGAIGPQHFCALVNRAFAVHDRANGVQLFSESLQNFLPGSTGDPRILFDQHSERWIVIATNFGGQIQLGISLTSDPLGAWFKTAFHAAAGADTGCTVDYPTLGVDAHGIYVGAYMAGGCALTLFAIDKAPLLAPTPSLGTITAFRNLSPVAEGALQPAHTYGTAAGEYVVSITADAIRVRRVNPPLSAPTISTIGVAVIGSFAAPLNVPALGSTVPLKTYDTRLMNAVVRDGSLWTTHHVRLDGRAAVRWYELDASSAALVQSGSVDDPVLHYFYPSIAVNGDRDVVLGFSGSSAAQYAGAYFCGRLSSDPAGEMAPPEVLRPGAAAYNVLDPLGFNRWGDYSLTTLDPIGERRLWTIQEYSALPNTWGTWIGALEFGGTPICPDPLAYCVGAPNSAGAGARIASAGSTSASIQDLVLFATGAAPNQSGTFYYGHTSIQVPFGNGFRCVGGGTYRFPTTASDAFGDASVAVDFTQPPANAGPGALAIGTTWRFQYWYRDPAAGGAGFNLSDGLELTICP